MDTSILNQLPRGVRAVLAQTAPWADGYWGRRNPRVKLVHYRTGSTVMVDGCPVLTTEYDELGWFCRSWAAARAARAARAADCRKAEKAYKALMEAAVEAQGALRYVPGQEGGRLVLPSGASVSARGLFRRMTGRAWIWDSEEFQDFLREVTNPPENHRLQSRKARNNPLSEAQASYDKGSDQKVQMLYQDW